MVDRSSAGAWRSTGWGAVDRWETPNRLKDQTRAQQVLEPLACGGRLMVGAYTTDLGSSAAGMLAGSLRARIRELHSRPYKIQASKDKRSRARFG